MHHLLGLRHLTTIYSYIHLKEDRGWKELNLIRDNHPRPISFLSTARSPCRVRVSGCIPIYMYIYKPFYIVSRDKDIEPLVLNGSFYKTVFMFGRKRGSSSIYLLRYKYIIPSVLIFIFKTTRLIYFFFRIRTWRVFDLMRMKFIEEEIV